MYQNTPRRNKGISKRIWFGLKFKFKSILPFGRFGKRVSSPIDDNKAECCEKENILLEVFRKENILWFTSAVVSGTVVANMLVYLLHWLAEHQQ